MNITNDLERRIADAFQIFDHHGNKTVDVREVGSIIRYLGCVPDENEICQIISATELADSSGVVHLSKFLPHVQQLLLEHKMEPATPEVLLKAFQIFDPENNGHICRQFMSKILMEEGEQFTQVSTKSSYLWPEINGGREKLLLNCFPAGGTGRNDGRSCGLLHKYHSV